MNLIFRFKDEVIADSGLVLYPVCSKLITFLLIPHLQKRVEFKITINLSKWFTFISKDESSNL